MPAAGDRCFPETAVMDVTLDTIGANLALDEALLVEAEERGAAPVLRFWESAGLAVVLGASSRIHDDVDVERCRDAGVEIQRRSSGGGTVVVGPGALNVAVVVPASANPALGAVDSTQSFVLNKLAKILAGLGRPASVQGLGDLTTGDRKFAGSAQRRLRRNVMVHVSLLYEFPLDLVTRFTRPPKKQPAYRNGRSHADFLTNFPESRARIVGAITDAWHALGSGVETRPVPVDILNRLIATKYADRSWVTRL